MALRTSDTQSQDSFSHALCLQKFLQQVYQNVHVNILSYKYKYKHADELSFWVFEMLFDGRTFAKLLNLLVFDRSDASDASRKPLIEGQAMAR